MVSGKAGTSRNQTQFSSAGQTHHAKVAPIEREDRINLLSIRQVNQTGIGKLDAEVFIFCKYRYDSGKIRRVQTEQIKGTTAE